MADRLQFTPDALDDLLADLDREAFVAFVADLHRREGRTVEREETRLLTTRRNGTRERVLVWTDDRSRLGRLFGSDPDVPAEPVDAVVARNRDDASARAIANATDARVVGTDDLHDRLLYAIDRADCQALCRAHFDRDVEPQPKPDPDDAGATIGRSFRPRTVLATVALLVALVAVTAGLPVSPGGPPVDAGTGTPVAGPTAAPIGAGGPTPTETPMPTPAPDDISIPDAPRVDLGDSARVTAGETATITVTIGNENEIDFRNVTVTLRPPAGNWTVTPADGRRNARSWSRVTLGDVPAGTAGETTWELTVPEGARGEYPLSVYVQYATDPVVGQALRIRTIEVESRDSGGCPGCTILSLDGEPGAPGGAPGSNGSGGGTAVPGSTITIGGTLTNTKAYDFARVETRLALPDDNWTVTSRNGTDVGALRPGESRRVAWNVTVPRTAYGTYDLTAEAVYPTLIDETLVRQNYTLRVEPPAPVCELPPSQRCHLLAFDAGRLHLTAGETTTVTGGLYNPRGYNYTDVAVRLAAPGENWTITPVAGTTAATFDGDRAVRRVAWNVTVPGDATGEYVLRSDTAYNRSGARTNVSFSYPVSVTNGSAS